MMKPVSWETWISFCYCEITMDKAIRSIEEKYWYLLGLLIPQSKVDE